MRSTARVTDVLVGRRGLVLAGTAAALVGAGAGTAGAATTTTPAAPAPAAAAGAAGLAAARLDSVLAGVKAGPARGAHELPPAGQLRPAKARTVARRARRAGVVPAADRLRPVPVFGPQQQMPVGAGQLANAKTIVAAALAKKMGVRSAVIAVATSMQEAGLTNIGYGTSDSLGLFQQRPSMGWGTAAQIMNPHYAADAFLSALGRYQAANPGWAHQPLYQTAQAVQGSAYPTAYAKWEAQAAGLVQQITTPHTR
jgi:hypothetical protein